MQAIKNLHLQNVELKIKYNKNIKDGYIEEMVQEEEEMAENNIKPRGCDGTGNIILNRRFHRR